MSESAPTKRLPRKRFYDADGRRILTALTERRHRQLLQAGRRAESHGELLGNMWRKKRADVSKKKGEPKVTSSDGPSKEGNTADHDEEMLTADDSTSYVDNLQHRSEQELSDNHDSDQAHHYSDNNSETASSHDDSSEDNAEIPEDDGPSDRSSSAATAASSGSGSCEADEDLNIPDHEGYNVDKLTDFINAGGDAIMFREANLNAWQVVLVVLGLCHRFSLNLRGRRALIEATKLFAGPAFDSWDISDYEIAKVFDPPDEVIRYHFYCEVCCKELEESTTKRQFKKHEAVCRSCLAKYKLTMNSPNCFIHIDLKYQITSLLGLPVIIEGLFENLKKINMEVGSGDGTIRDVYDGLLYKKLLSENKDEDSQLLTYVFNTDGAPLFNSSKRGFWPIQLIINELPTKIRFKYPLLVGVCVVKKEPSPDFMNTFLKSFVEEANNLCIEGFQVKMNDGSYERFLLKPLACSVDSVARPILQNRLQFNGYHGCSWCYSMGTHTNGCTRFLMERDDPPDRTHEDHMKDSQAVVSRIQSSTVTSRRITVRGVKGESVLQELKHFDMIWAFVRDYLHADLAGVATQMMNMWSDRECPIRLTKKQLDEVNERLMGMTPPHEIHRLVRPLKTERAKWKASEWRSWLLFYAVPCLCGILEGYALQHFALLVTSLHTLLRTKITEEDLTKVDRDLMKFVIVFELLYGPRYVTFNIHSLRHLVRCVRYCGPLWGTSTFPFESAIRNYKRSVHGAKGVYEQMSKRNMQGNILQSLVMDAEDDSAACYAFNKSLFGKFDMTKSFRRTDGGSVLLIGQGTTYDNNDEDDEVQYEGGDNDLVLKFKRCIKSGTVVSSVAYDRQKKSNDTFFIDKRGVVVQVLYLLCRNDNAFARVACFESRNVVIENVGESRETFQNCPIVINDVIVDHLFLLDEERYCKTVPITDLAEKCVYMKVSGKHYVSRLPNTIEIQ